MKKILSLIIALMLILSSTAFAEIILAHDKLNPNYQPYFEAWAKMCKEATGVTFTPVSYPSTDIFTANMKAALPTDAAPQIFTWWSTWQGAELVQAGLVRDLTEVWDELKDEYDEGLRGAFTFDGKVYGFPLDLAYWFMWYNTDLYEKYGLKVPQTWDEMMANCDVLVKNGVTPFSLTGSDSWTSFIWFEELLMHSNPQAYEDLCAGKIKWTDDAVKNVFVIWKGMIDKGYFTTGNPDYFTDIPKMFTEDRLAMIMGGSWYLSPQLDSAYADGKVGAFLVPNMEGQPDGIIYEVSSVQVAKNVKEEDVADVLKVVKYMMSKEGNLAYAKEAKKIPGNPSASTEHVLPVISDRIKEISDKGYQLHNRFWENCPTPIMSTAIECFDAFIKNPTLETADEYLKVVQDEADDYYS